MFGLTAGMMPASPTNLSGQFPRFGMPEYESDGMAALNCVDERLQRLYFTLPRDSRDPKTAQLRSLLERILQEHQTLKQMLPYIQAQLQNSYRS